MPKPSFPWQIPQFDAGSHQRFARESLFEVDPCGVETAAVKAMFALSFKHGN